MVCKQVLGSSRVSVRPTRWKAWPVRCARRQEGGTKKAVDELPADPSPQPEDASSEEPTTLSERLGKLAADIAVNPISYIVATFIAVELVSLLGEQDYLIFVLAALPVVGLTALSKSSVGEEVASRLKASLPELERDAAQMKNGWEDAMARSPAFGADRPKVPSALGGGAAHLRGEVPGDVGFDPLSLGADPERFAWNQEAELLHARWAMLATIGAVIPEALALAGTNIGEAVWWKVGAAKLQGDITLNYAGIEGFRIAGKQGIWLIALCQLALMGGPEYARYVGIDSLQPVGVFLPGTQTYPGGVPFDPLKISKSPDDFIKQQVNEIWWGRLAMVAMLGYFVQAYVTRKGPVQNILDFVSDPAHNNILSYLR